VPAWQWSIAINFHQSSAAVVTPTPTTTRTSTSTHACINNCPNGILIQSNVLHLLAGARSDGTFASGTHWSVNSSRRHYGPILLSLSRTKNVIISPFVKFTHMHSVSFIAKLWRKWLKIMSSVRVVKWNLF